MIFNHIPSSSFNLLLTKFNDINIVFDFKPCDKSSIADIYIDSIGRKEILEKKLKEDKNLFYNEEGFMEAK